MSTKDEAERRAEEYYNNNHATILNRPTYFIAGFRAGEKSARVVRLEALVRCADSIFKSMQKTFSQWNEGEHMDYRDWEDAKKNSGHIIHEIPDGGNKFLESFNASPEEKK